MEEAVAVAVAPLGQRLTESVGNEVDCYYKSVAFHDNVDDDNAFCSVSQDLRRCFWNF